MNQDSVRTLLRLRRLAVDGARRDLANCVAHETVAQEAARALSMSIAQETAEACRLEGGDQAVHAFAAWLQRIRPAACAADAAVEQAALRTVEARAVLAAAQAAAEAAQQIIAQHAAARAATLRGSEQQALDEAGAIRRDGATT